MTTAKVKHEAMQTPLFRYGQAECKIRPRVVWLMLMLALTLVGCGDGLGLPKEERAALYKANAQAIEKCNAKWVGKPRVPIRGSDYVLDATRLPWGMAYETWTKDEECGAATINGLFYWTGNKIIPEAIWLKSGRKLTELPEDVLVFDIRALLGAPPDSVRHCKARPEDCKGPPGPPVDWPNELVVRLKHYEDLEVRMYRKKDLAELRPTDVTHSMGFFLRGWPREDGAPRVVSCDVGRDVYKMTRVEIENIDFGKQTRPCQLEFWGFEFNGGSARVYTNTAMLHQIIPALHALHQYLNESITKEKS